MKYLAVATCIALASGATTTSATELVGAVQFDENHAFTKHCASLSVLRANVPAGR